MRTTEETMHLLDTSLLWNGEALYFSYNDQGSIGYGTFHADAPKACRAFFDTYEALLKDADAIYGATKESLFFDSLISGMSIDIIDSPDYFEEAGETPSEEERNAYLSLLSELSIDTERDGFLELTFPRLLFAMQQKGTLPSTSALKKNYPNLSLLCNQKEGIDLSFDFYGESLRVELVQETYVNGALCVQAYLSDPKDASFGEPFLDVTCNLSSPVQKGTTVFLNTNGLNGALLKKVEALGCYTGKRCLAGFSSYPAFTFDQKVLSSMRTLEEFAIADHEKERTTPLTSGIREDMPYDLSCETQAMQSAKCALAGDVSPIREEDARA